MEYYLGLDKGGSKIHAAVCRDDGELIGAQRGAPTPFYRFDRDGQTMQRYRELGLAQMAAVTGDRDTALLALVSHPLVREYDVAVPLLEELLQANKAYLPQFFKK